MPLCWMDMTGSSCLNAHINRASVTLQHWQPCHVNWTLVSGGKAYTLTFNHFFLKSFFINYKILKQKLKPSSNYCLWFYIAKLWNRFAPLTWLESCTTYIYALIRTRVSKRKWHSVHGLDHQLCVMGPFLNHGCRVGLWMVQDFKHADGAFTFCKPKPTMP